MSTAKILNTSDFRAIVTSLILIAIISYLGQIVYAAFFGPLSRFPGPRFHAISKIPGIYTMITGRDASARCILHERYGSIVRVGPTELSFNGGAEAWDAIYGFPKTHGPRKPFKDPLFYTHPVNGSPDIASANDSVHTRQRRALSHAFSDRAIREQEPVLQKWTAKMKAKMLEQTHLTGKVDILKYLNCTTFDIMGDLTFGEGLNMLDDGELSPWVATIFGAFKAFTFWRCVRTYSAFTRWFVERVLFNSKKVRAMQWENFMYCKSRMEGRLSREPDHPDFWTRILDKSRGEDVLTRDEHDSNAVLFMVAGTETTATALSGLIYLLHQKENQTALDRLKSEIHQSISCFEDMSLERLARLEFLQAVLKEGLRMYPPVPSGLPRLTPVTGIVFRGEYVPAGTTVSVHHWSTYRSPKHFKNPNEFHPERWLGEDPIYKADNLDAMEPFGFGPRNCLGKNFAWHEMRLLLSTILLTFEVKLAAEASHWIDQETYTMWEKKHLLCSLAAVDKSTKH